MAEFISQDLNILISKTPETAFNVAKVAGTDFYRAVMRGNTFGLPVLDKIDSSDLVGTGFEFPQIPLRVNYWQHQVMTIGEDVNVDLFPLFLTRAFGGTNSAPATVNVSARQHTLLLGTSAQRQLPSSNLITSVGYVDDTHPGADMLWMGVVPESVQISQDAGGVPTWAVELVGSGKFTSPLPSGVRTGLPSLVGSGAGGTQQVETATVVGTITVAGSIAVTVTAANMAGSPIVVNVPVLVGDDATAIATKIRVAMVAHPTIGPFFIIGGTVANVIFTTVTQAANDATMNIALATGTATGLTAAPTAANTTAGVAGTDIKDSYVHPAAVVITYTDGTVINLATAGKIRSWNFQFNNNLRRDDRRPGDPFRTANDPTTGAFVNRLQRGKRTCAAQIVVSLDENITEFITMSQNRVVDNLAFIMKGQLIPGASPATNYTVEIDIPKAQLRTVTPTNVNDDAALTLDWFPLKGTGEYVSATVINTKTTAYV